jgi:putative hydrolase
LGSEPFCVEILETVHALDWKVALSSDSHVHYTVGDVDIALKKIQRIGFPESQVVTMNPRRLLEFLAEHGKPVVDELAEWLAEIDSPAIIEM